MRIRLFITCILVAISSHALAENNYIESQTLITPSYGTDPTKGESRTEATTGAVITRRTDITELTPDLPADAMIVYSRYSPVSSDGAYLLVHGTDSSSCWLVRVSDNVVVKKLARSGGSEIGENNEIRWDYSGDYPNRVYFVYGMGFYSMDVITSNGSPTLVRDFSTDFPSGVKIINDVEGDSSADSRYWAWQVLGTYVDGAFPRLAFFTYDKQANSIGGTFEPSDATSGEYTTSLPKPNMVEISPSGGQVILNYGTASDYPFVLPGTWVSDGDGVYHMVGYKAYSAGNSVFSYVNSDGTDTLELQGTTSGSAESITGASQYAVNSSSDTIWVRLTDDSDPTGHTINGNRGLRPWDDGTELDGSHAFDLDFTDPVKVAIGETHSGWGWTSDGDELFVSQDNTRDYFQACRTDGIGGTYPDNCFDFYNHNQSGTYTNLHFARMPSTRPGWILVSTYDTTSNWDDNQLLMMELVDMGATTPTVWSVSPTYNEYAGNYRDEASAAVSCDGDSIWWTGNWGDATSGHGEVYSIDITGWCEHYELGGCAGGFMKVGHKRSEYGAGRLYSPYGM